MTSRPDPVSSTLTRNWLIENLDDLGACRAMSSFWVGVHRFRFFRQESEILNELQSVAAMLEGCYSLKGSSG